MNRLDWEYYCRKRRFVPLKREETKHGTILIAERYDAHDPGVAEKGVVIPHWKVMYMFERGKLDFVQWIALPWNKPQHERIKECIMRAETFIADNLEAGRYE